MEKTTYLQFDIYCAQAKKAINSICLFFDFKSFKKFSFIILHSQFLITLFFLFISFVSFGQNAPQATIIQPINGTYFEGEQVKVVYVISGSAPNFVRIMVDDRAAQLISDAKLGQNTVIVDAPKSDFKISIIAVNDYGSGIPAAVNLKRSEHIFKPVLYILAVGVSNYNDHELRLQFAAKDAIDFTLSMTRQQGLLYEKVELRLLTNEQATSENVRDGLQWLQKETTYRDVAMMFMAGHGINNNVGDFFFMPVNADIDRLNATCVGYREIKETIDAVSGKMLVFMDACHSGNVLGNNQRRAAMVNQAITELTDADNGAVVFTSSTGRQSSLENSEWNNGAFTKALVEGLNGAADMLGSLSVTIKNLDLYITNRVKELTKGQQSPTTIIPRSVPDFPIAIVTDEYASNTKTETLIIPEKETKETNQKTETQNITHRKEKTKKETVDKAEKKPTQKIYCAVAVGAGDFGTVLDEKINKPALNFGADVVYFFIPQFGAGLKTYINTASVEVDNVSFSDNIVFYGVSIDGCLPFNKLNIIASAAFGKIDWKMKNVVNENIQYNNEKYSATGGIVSIGVNYMIIKNLGIVLNAQSILGSVDNNRYPAGIGGNVGICFKF